VKTPIRNRLRGVRAHRALLLAALSILAPVAGISSAETARAAVASELGDLLAAQASAWSRGDLDAFASLYAEDALFLSPTGTTRGRAELVERYRRRYPDAAAMGRLTLEVVEVRAGSETAGVAARWTLSYPDRPEATGLTLLVFRKSADRWQIVQDASF
jgi:uncharacterized protein (TIGR02246 family)